MSYQERRTLASLISTLIVAVFFSIYVFQRYPAGNPYSAEAFHFWGSTFIVLIPVSIAASILVDIVFSMAYSMTTREKERRLSDERDQLIALRGFRNAAFAYALGTFLAMGSLALNQPPSVMFLVLFISGYVSGVFGDLSRLYFYRRGF